ncbi:response regulator transcription factor [Enterococcus gallinarum]|uniref:response regulator transcription factor n=1 Tax=Enterococcus gallinarum TaxID=1353 RepID=UPI001E52DA0E|nr:response regulator [Enterococcus gallinarum]MCD4987719.1 response regulator [Enterococcus gallinarum]MDT2722078.1 response regulator [Enterococcus gallinarum]
MHKYSVVIVDDEELSIKAIEQIINRSNLPIEEVLSFNSSKEALSHLKHQSCDILITDLNMPDISGLELIRAIRSFNELTEIIVVTGFGSLAYATQAMEYGIRYFLEKPFYPQKIEESIQNAITSVNKKRDQIFLEEKNVIEQLVLEQAVTPIPISNFSYIMYYETARSYLGTHLREYFEQLGIHYVVGSYRNAIVQYFFNCKEIDLSLFATYPKREQNKNYVISVAVNQSVNSIKDSFEKSYQSLEMAFYYEHISILPLSQVTESIIKNINDLSGSIDSNFKHAVLDQQFTNAKKMLPSLRHVCQLSFISPNNLKSQILPLIKQSLLTFGKDYVFIQNFEQDVAKAQSYTELQTTLEAGLDNLSIASLNIPSDNPISKNINLIIENYYPDSELSLKWISKKMLFLNPDYVGKVYQRETGIKFTTKLLEVRMSNAYRLLSEGKKVYEVAALVGFGNNSDYFSRLFKKKFKISPSSILEQKV